MENRWLAIIAIIAVVAIAAVGASWLFRTAPTTDSNPGFGPGYYGMDIGGPNGSHSNGLQLYNFTVNGVDATLLWSDTNFSVWSSVGMGLVQPGAGWKVTIFEIGGALVATYDFAKGSPGWTSGGGAAVIYGETVQFAAPSAPPLSGDGFLLSVTGGGIQGSVSIRLP